ncbi:DUF3967 domain-containing protein [Peribacillus butanolivorans]|nr:DUF3967 domain-containing protein [Peribacillus butanolivorans]
METSSNKRDENLLSLIREVQDPKKMIAVSQKKKWREYWK